MTDPTPQATEAMLTDIAANGIWGEGLAPSDSVLSISQALLAALRGEEGSQLAPELAELVAEVRGIATTEASGIAGADGVRLSGLALKLRDGKPHPVVIVPAGWNPYGWLPFLYLYVTLARKGYHVLAYTPRGIGIKGWVSTSEGFIDVGGPNDWADGARVIDFAQEHFAPSGIGFLGESYGSGISQLVAAHDPARRVEAVVALSTWGNLATSLYANNTRHLAAVNALIGFTGGPMEEKFDEETQRILRNFLAGQELDEVVEWGTRRSPQTWTDRTNELGIPTFVSNTWHETLFPVGPVIETFQQLTVPKRLNLWIGDHGAPEGPGLAGLATGLPFPGLAEPIREAFDWLDHHLLGADNEVPQWPQVATQSMFSYRTVTVPGGSELIVAPARREFHGSWDDVTVGSETWYLTGTGATADGALTDKQTTGWSREFVVGDTPSATAGVLLKTGQQEWYGNPRRYELPAFEREQLLVWSTDPLTAQGDEPARRIRGAATLRLTVRSSASSATLVAYLFDVAPDGAARLVTHEPYTATELEPGTDTAVDWQLQAAAYDLPAGHRLALVVNSRDPLYSTVALTGGTTTVSAPASLELPLG